MQSKSLSLQMVLLSFVKLKLGKKKTKLEYKSNEKSGVCMILIDSLLVYVCFIYLIEREREGLIHGILTVPHGNEWND